MWTTRPVRLPRSQFPNTWFFGVCEGIAVRYQVSPVLVRLVVGLSVTLDGLGLWFYLVALLVMPRYRRPAVAGGGAAEERAGPALHP